MNVPDELPELGEMIPKVPGQVYEYQGHHWVGLEHMVEVTTPNIGRKKDLIRVGFKLYEITGYDSHQKAYELRPFRATLSVGDLARLSGQSDG